MGRSSDCPWGSEPIGLLAVAVPHGGGQHNLQPSARAAWMAWHYLYWTDQDFSVVYPGGFPEAPVHLLPLSGR